MPGTIKSHAVVPKNGGRFSREESCYCQDCLKREKLCGGWIWHCMSKKTAEGTNDRYPEIMEELTATERQEIIPEVDDFVAAVYDGQWYISRVEKVDNSDRDAYISFMKKARGSSSTANNKWPHPPDEIWMNFNQIIRKINTPEPVGKSGREFKIEDDDLDGIHRLLQQK